jgi:hypothetical protein
MTGSLRGMRACLLAALVTMGVSSCNQIPRSGGDREARVAAGAPSLCDTSILKVDNSGWYTDVAGKMWVVGELSNTSGTDRLLPQICVSIRTATGERTERRYAGPILLKAGEGVSFSAIIENPPDDDFSVGFAAASQPADGVSSLVATLYRDFNASVSVRMSPGDKDADIHGILTNTGGLPASNIFVAVGLYDKEGALVGVAKGKVSSLDILDPGSTLTFTLVSSQLSQNTTSFTTRIFVEGQITEGSN